MSIQQKGNTLLKDRNSIHEPSMYDVVLLNDDFTTMEFVVAVLMTVFYLSESDAEQVMMSVHQSGQGIAGTYTLDIAKSKVRKAVDLARKEGYPLRLKVQAHD